MAATTPPLEEIAHDDHCPICHLLFYDPVKTGCNHVLCASCLVQWADASSLTNIMPSSLNLDLGDFSPDFDPVADLAHIESNCPMCRTSTTATRIAELAAALEERYPRTYTERRTEEEEARGQQRGQDGVEGMMILIGNKHRLDRDTEGSHNKHDWTFFVRCSRPDIVKEVRVNLHPTFRPPRVILRGPPFEVRRLGWGIFRIDAEIVLKDPYMFVEGMGATASARRKILELDWMLCFEDRGKQGRVRVKVKNMGNAQPGAPSQGRERRRLPSVAPRTPPRMNGEDDGDDEDDEDDEDNDEDYED